MQIAENLDTASDGTSLHAANRVGHQGLFFERFAGDYTTQPLSPTDGAGLYFNRNRFYSPTLGRFIQRDPNETALPILTALATNAETLAVNFGPFDAQALYSNGPNLYQYEASNPVNSRDPSGLDAWEDIDDAIGDVIGSRVATVGYVREASGYALLGLNAAVDLAGGMLGLDLLGSVGNILRGEGGFWDYVQVGAAATGGAAVMWKVFKWGKEYNKLRKMRSLLAANKRMGQAFESLVLKTLGYAKNTKKVHFEGANAIPDVITASEVIEIKSEIAISLTPQLKVIGNWAKQNGKQAVLIVSDRNQKVYKPVHDLFRVKVFGE